MNGNKTLFTLVSDLLRQTFASDYVDDPISMIGERHQTNSNLESSRIIDKRGCAKNHLLNSSGKLCLHVCSCLPLLFLAFVK